jgi:hypothetical protein
MDKKFYVGKNNWLYKIICEKKKLPLFSKQRIGDGIEVYYIIKSMYLTRTGIFNLSQTYDFELYKGISKDKGKTIDKQTKVFVCFLSEFAIKDHELPFYLDILKE